ncbi:MAG TPA: class I SAM-dependent methyltransferase [Kiritimatiellia bacterium]|nr:class I SAM-dependent methyltransferase [Kiritimatiellia bacterium]
MGLFKEKLLSAWLASRNRNSLNRFVKGADAEQNAIDLFKGEWVASFPPQVKVSAGNKALWDDPRIRWLGEHFEVQGKSVLELGPMEGSHTRQVIQMGASSVISIESNGQSFMKCLIAKELLELNRARFLCADFVEYLDRHTDRHDLCLASGVLYHMADPVKLIGLACTRADAVYFWTHYYDDALIKSNSAHRHRFGAEKEMAWGGFQARVVHRSYGASVWNPLHLGGDTPYSRWMRREDILAALRHFGKTEIHVGCEDVAHPAGPSFCVFARSASK